MSTTYNGVAGGTVVAPSITIPSDGDALAVSSVNSGMQKLTDYLASFASYGPIISFNAATAVPNTASNNYALWLYGFSTAVPGTSGAGVGTNFLTAFAGRIIAFAYSSSLNPAGGTVNLQVVVGGTPTTIQANPSSGNQSGTCNVTFNALQQVSFQVANGAGVTQSVGTIQVLLFTAPK